MKVKFKKLYENAEIPTKANPGDAGLDLKAAYVVSNNGKFEYGTGLAVEIPEGYVGLVFPRSSIHKKDIRLTNGVGVIDSGYRGEIKAVFDADGLTPRDSVTLSKEQLKQYYDRDSEGPEEVPLHRIYKTGDKIVQLVILPLPEIEVVEELGELSPSDRGDKGFGSSGQ